MLRGSLFALRSSATLVQQPLNRGFARVPMIKFLGPRSKTNKSIGMYASAPGHGPAAAAETPADQSSKKPLSRDCELEFADIPADRWARLPFSEAEIETINLGTNEIEQDWRQIRL